MSRQKSPDDLRASIRRLELETGLREWDAQDDREAAVRLHAMVRYVDADAVKTFVAEEKQRLGIA